MLIRTIKCDLCHKYRRGDKGEKGWQIRQRLSERGWYNLNSYDVCPDCARGRERVNIRKLQNTS